MGLCVISLLCIVVLGGYWWTAQEQAGSSEEGSSEESATAVAPSSATKGSNELVLLNTDPPTLDPALATDATSSGYIVEIFGGLVTLEPELNVVPDLAESWEVSEDGTLYTFTLRGDATFANGKPVTANDFKYSLERACDPATLSVVADTYLGDIVGCRDKLDEKANEVAGVRVVDEKTLELQIDGPKVYFLAKLTYPTGFVVDKANIEKEGRLWASTNPNGTGPFKLAEYSFGEKVVLVPNENYYGDPKPSIERVTYILSGGSGMTLYETNEIDMVGVGVADIDRVLDPSNALNPELLEVENMSVSYIALNIDTPPFDDPLVRQALNMAIDKETLIQVVGRGITRPAYGVLPPGFPGFNPDLQGLEFDVERAKELLAQSKYGGAEGLPDITLHTSGGGGSASEETEAIIEMWRKNLGVEAAIEQAEWATFLNDISLKPNPYQAFSIAWIADYPDPQNFLDILFHCQSLDNRTGYCNPEVDALLEQARTEQDQATRFGLYQQAEQTMISEAAWIPLWYSRGYVLVKPWVKDYYFPPTIVSKLKYVQIQQ